MEPYSWHLAEVNAAALEPIQTTALLSTIKFPPTRPSALKMQSDIGSNMLSCVGRRDQFDAVERSQKHRGCTRSLRWYNLISGGL